MNSSNCREKRRRLQRALVLQELDEQSDGLLLVGASERIPSTMISTDMDRFHPDYDAAAGLRPVARSRHA